MRAIQAKTVIDAPKLLQPHAMVECGRAVTATTSTVLTWGSATQRHLGPCLTRRNRAEPVLCSAGSVPGSPLRPV
jgi:hypothetical protein